MALNILLLNHFFMEVFAGMSQVTYQCIINQIFTI